MRNLLASISVGFLLGALLGASAAGFLFLCVYAASDVGSYYPEETGEEQ